MGLARAADLRGGTSARVRRAVSVQQILEWAFRVERARLWDAEPRGLDEPAGYGLEYVLIERARLGCRVDGGGQSWPHEDAETVAALVEQVPETYGGRRMAAAIAEHARCGSTPDWMPGARVRCVPVAWAKPNQHGATAKTELVEVITHKHRGRTVRREVWACPVTYTPTAQQLAAARRHYLLWRMALTDLRHRLGYVTLRDHVLTDVLPPAEPWAREGC